MTLSRDRRGLALAPQLAAFAASLGLSTRFVLATAGDAAASLRAACSAERASELRPGLRLEARTESAGPESRAEIPDGASFDDLMAVAIQSRSPAGQEDEDAGCTPWSPGTPRRT